MKLSIVVPTLNEETYLPRLLQSIIDQKYTEAHEVIVVDAHSDDKTLDVARQYEGEISDLRLFTCDRGVSKQRNYGAKQAKYEALVFLDADTKLMQGSLEALAKRASSLDDFIAMPIIYPYDGKLVDYVLGTISYVYIFFVQWSSPITSGMCIVTTKSVRDRINGFDEKMTYAEDIDYGLRAFKNGAAYRILYNVQVRASARRLDASGRIKIGMTWLRWYGKAKKDRESLYVEDEEYGFGEFDQK